MRVKIFPLIGLTILSSLIVIESCLPSSLSSQQSNAIFNLFSGKSTLEYIEPINISDISYPDKIYVNRFIKLNPVFIPENTTDKRVNWTFDETCAEINGEGYIRFLKEGSFVLKATSVINPSLSKEIEIQAHVVEITDISLSIIEEKELFINSTLQLKVDYYPHDATYQKIEYFSKNPNIAVVNEHGIIYGVSPGSAIVYAKDVRTNIESNALMVTVLNSRAEPVTEISVPDQIQVYCSSLNEVTVIFNEQATDKSYHFENVDEQYIEIVSGKLLAKMPTDNTYLKVVSNSNPEINQDISVTVIPVLAKQIILNSFNSLEIGKEEQLTYDLIPEIPGLEVTNKSVFWEVSDVNKAIIDEYGKIFGIATGQVSIKITWQDDANVFSKRNITISTLSRSSYNRIVTLIRKGIGHFALFLCTGIMAVVYFSMQLKNKKIILPITLSYGLFLACISEFCQIFATNRASSLIDVIINVSGFSVGLLLVSLFKKVSQILKYKT